MSYFMFLIGLVGAGTWLRRNRKAALLTLGGVGGAAVIISVVVSPSNPSSSQTPTPANITININAGTDFGRLPSRVAYCGSVGSLGTPDVCYEGLGSDGATLADSGTKGWTLTKNGSPRTGIVTGVPVETSSGGVNFTGELGVGGDGTSGNFYEAASVSTSSASVLSISYVGNFTNQTSTSLYVMSHYGGGKGFRWRTRFGSYNWYVYSASGTGTVTHVGGIDGATHCWTIVLDARTANAVKLFRDGVDASSDLLSDDLSGHGGFAEVTATDFLLLGEFGSIRGWISRSRLDYGKAASLSDHQALCGSYGSPVKPTNSVYADMTWTGSGVWCTATGNTTAACWGAGSPGWHQNSTKGSTWAVSGKSLVNNILYSTRPNCTDWTCSTATMAGTAAPTGQFTEAAAITMGGGYVETSGSGYTASAALNLSMWTKCSSGTLTIAHQGGTGSWTVDCTAVAGSWALLTPTHAAVTVGAGMQADGAGAITLRLSGADTSVWGITAVEAAQTDPPITIPTQSAGVTHNTTWTIDNSDGSYYGFISTANRSVVQHSGECFVVEGSDIQLNGSTATGAQCSWESLTVSGERLTTPGRFVFLLAGQSNMLGSAPVGSIPPDRVAIPPGVDYWVNGVQRFTFDWSSGFGPEVEFAYDMREKYPYNDIILVKTADGARSLYGAFWPVDDAGRQATAGDASWLYGDLLPNHVAAVASKTNTVMKGILWVQGEADAKVEICSTTYESNLNVFLTAVLNDIGSFPRFAGVRLRSDIAGRNYEAGVRAAMTNCPTAMPGGIPCFMIDSDSYVMQGDNLHYNAASVIQMGADFAAVF